RCEWGRIVRRRLTHLVHTLGIFSVVILLLLSCSTTGDEGCPLTLQKPSVSALPVQAFLSTTDDQGERTGGHLGPSQMVRTNIPSIKFIRVVCSPYAWLYTDNGTLLTQILTTWQDRSPPFSMSVSIIL